MPYSDYRPDLMGHATLSPTGRFEAGSMQSFTLIYTAGAFGVDDTGSIKIGFRFATDFGPVQFTDPKAPGYTTVEASNGADARRQVGVQAQHPPLEPLALRRRGEGLPRPGDTITIRFGDRRQGSPGIRLQTYCESEFEFRVLADPIATYDYVAIPESPKIAIVPGPGVRWRAVLPSHGAGGRAVPAVHQGRRQVGQSLQPHRPHAAASSGDRRRSPACPRRCASRRAASPPGRTA